MTNNGYDHISKFTNHPLKHLTALSSALALLFTFAAVNSRAAVTLDSGFAPNPNGAVRAIAIQPSDGKIIIGGDFTSVNSTTRQRLARLGTNGSLESFNPSFNDSVRAVVVQSGGQIVVGGSFTNVNGYSKKYLARLDSDGTLESSYPYDGEPNGPVHSLALHPGGKVLAAGEFTQIGSASQYYVARFNADSTLDSSFNPTVNAPVYSVALNSSTNVAIGGSFSSIGAYTRTYVAVLDSDGSVNQTFAPTPGPNAPVYSVHISDSTNVAIAGGFTTVNNVTRGRFARLSPSGTLLTQGTGLNSEAYVTVSYDGGFLVGGHFWTAGPFTREKIVWFNSSGDVDQGVDFGSVSGSWVRAIAIEAGRIIMGGSFGAVQTNTRDNLARFLP
jgi:uncharacterized delta-60 repeat protein